jgi:hypothetical protein
VHTGAQVAGMQCAQGGALYFDAEAGEDETVRRFRLAGIPGDAVTVYDADGLHILRHALYLRRVIKTEQPSLVVFDSLRTMASGADEDSSRDMEPIMGTLRRIARSLRVAVLLIHHRGKGEPPYRGSSAIRDQTDLMFMLARERADPERATRRYIDTVKCRAAAEPPRRWLRIDTDEDGRMAVTATEGYAPSGGNPVREAVRDALDALLGADFQPAAWYAKQLGKHPENALIRELLSELKTAGVAHHDRRKGWRRASGQTHLQVVTDPTETDEP